MTCVNARVLTGVSFAMFVCLFVGLGRPWVFSFEVKFYPTEPSMLQEDLTRFHYV